MLPSRPANRSSSTICFMRPFPHGSLAAGDGWTQSPREVSPGHVTRVIGPPIARKAAIDRVVFEPAGWLELRPRAMRRQGQYGRAEARVQITVAGPAVRLTNEIAPPSRRGALGRGETEGDLVARVHDDVAVID